MPGTSNSGRRKLTTQRHQLEGTFRKDRHDEAPSPEAPAGRPGQRKPLEGEAAEEFEKILADMELTGTLTLADGPVLYQYCQLFAETEEIAVERAEAKASAKILEENIRGLTGSDLVAVFQEIAKLRHDIKGYGTSLRQNRMAIRQYLVELGQTPAARAKVKAPAQKPKSKVDQFKGQKHAA